MSNGWGAFPNATGVSVRPRNRGTALAEFTMHAGQIRGRPLFGRWTQRRYALRARRPRR